MFVRSIRWRLQIFHGLILVLVLAGFGLTAYNLERNSRLERIDKELLRQITTLASIVRPGAPPVPRHWPLGASEERQGPESDLHLSSRQAGLFEGIGTNGFYFVVWSPDGRVQTQSDPAPSELPMPSRTVSPADEDQLVRLRGEVRELIHFTPHGRCILVGLPIGNELAELRRLAWWLGAAGLGVLILGLAGGWWAATHAMRPIEEIGATASRISAGNLSERIDIADTDSELGRLATVLNTTFARLDGAFSQQRQFTADASHELRTPLAALIAETQVSLSRPRSAADYRETVVACLETAQQMRRLTHSLLELARFDAGEEPIRREPFDLGDKVRESVQLVGPLAQAREIQINSELNPAPCVADPDRIGQVITNLLTNAIYYNRPKGNVNVTTHCDNGFVACTVSDTGIGIAQEDLPRIFERFYRADKSRSRADGRSGLGLAICKAIVDSHGGQIIVSSESGSGSCFRLTLPHAAAS